MNLLGWNMPICELASLPDFCLNSAATRMIIKGAIEALADAFALDVLPNV
jgi:hypothetical protein